MPVSSKLLRETRLVRRGQADRHFSVTAKLPIALERHQLRALARRELAIRAFDLAHAQGGAV
jgi:hypothetical protein